MKKITTILCAAIAVLMLSCATSQQDSTVRYTVASQKGDCVGVAPQKCLLVKKGDANEWEYLYSPIEGFNYEEGYEYVLDIKQEKLENVPADASNIKYILVKEVSKKAKHSENLPVTMTAQNEIQWIGKVLDVEKADVGQGAAQGRFPVTVAKIQVTSTESGDFHAGDTIHCELISTPTVTPVEGREYVFKAKNMHPAHARGVYLLETNVMDLVQ